MADLAFHNAPRCIGLNATMHMAIQGNGYVMIGDLAVTEEATLNHLHKYLRDIQVPGAAPAAQVRLPIVTLEKIKAMQY
jgi:hypothetical protein